MLTTSTSATRLAELQTIIKTVAHQHYIFEFEPTVYHQLVQDYPSFAHFFDSFQRLHQAILLHKENYDINPYQDTAHKGVYLLGVQDTDLGIFPYADLVWKCSQGKLQGGNLRHQFYRSQMLSYELAAKLSAREQELLQVCPVYLYMQSQSEQDFCKQILVMPRVKGKTLGEIPTGFTAEFCQVFQIPSLEKIQQRSRFRLHRWLDPHKQRQLLKIQTAYLFRRLWQKGIKILSLNQKNILLNSSSASENVHYTIIDPVADYFAPITPLYNLSTSLLCD